jgi:hypothetical protein
MSRLQRSNVLARRMLAGAARLALDEGRGSTYTVGLRLFQLSPVMQHLLDFVHEHAVEEQLYLVAATAAGDLELIWRRREQPDQWRLRPRATEGAWQLVPRREILQHLERCGADMLGIERELQAIVATQIAFADIVLRDATELLGREAVDGALHSQREFVTLLYASVRQLIGTPRPNVQVISGEASETPARSGHLTLIR